MLTLVNEGALEAVRNRGFRIPELSEQDLADVFELRLLLEVPSMGQLARMDIASAKDELEQLVVATEETVDDANEFLARDRDLHLHLLALRGNGRLLDMVRVLRDQTRLYGLGTGASRQLRVEAAHEHRQLVAHILEGDARAAERLMRKHLQHIQQEWYGTPASSKTRGA
jgi:DNA-binding GntR family transcriptional regulator